MMQFASLLGSINGPKAGPSLKVPIPSPDSETYWRELTDNLVEKVLGMEHVTNDIKLLLYLIIIYCGERFRFFDDKEIELIYQALNESCWTETMTNNFTHKLGVLEKVIIPINLK